jgi:hypothetical protein
LLKVFLENEMTKNIVRINLRERLLCRSSLEDFMLEESSLNDGVAGNTICERLSAAFNATENAQEKIQLLYLFRKENCKIPGASDKKYNGIVIEFGTNSGVDALAVYSDLQGGWFSGKDNNLLEFAISGHAESVYRQLRDAADRAILQTTSHPTDVPGPPPPGNILINFLSETGISFGGGASRDVASDRFGGPIIHAALQLRKLVLGMN